MTNPEIQHWFEKHGLPWSHVRGEAISEVGAECVEELKVVPKALPKDMFLILSWFDGEKFVQRAKAEVAWTELTAERIDLKKTAKEAPLDLETSDPSEHQNDNNNESYSPHVMKGSNNVVWQVSGRKKEIGSPHMVCLSITHIHHPES